MLIGNNTWLPDEQGGEKEGPYVRVHVPEGSKHLEKMLSNSMNVFEWDEKGLYRYCPEHVINAAAQMRAAESVGMTCLTCGKQAHFVY
ncbi:MAG: hypothetical protein IPM93_14105 [Candidatus Obscuribacter sp.]|nr:hypothetical protein [Candidatus Obscuribacter sp.]